MFAGSTYERIILLLVAGLQTFSLFAGEAIKKKGVEYKRVPPSARADLV